MQIAEDIYRLTDNLPKHEMYSLTNQLRRAAISVPSNIAEGHGRNSPREFNHFLGIALGSLSELETQLLLAVRLNYFKEQELIALLKTTNEAAKMLQGLKKSLNPKLPTND